MIRFRFKSKQYLNGYLKSDFVGFFTEKKILRYPPHQGKLKVNIYRQACQSNFKPGDYD